MSNYSYQQISTGKLFLKLFSFSFLLSLVLLLAYTHISGHQHDEGLILPLAFAGSLFLTAVLSIISFPGVIIARAINDNNRSSFLAYFFIPVIAIIIVLVSSLQDGDLQFYLIIATSYLLVSGFFYFTKPPKKKADTERTDPEGTN